MSERITSADLQRALEAHKDCLERYGVEFDGRLILSEGSKINGIAYRLAVTGFPYPCQSCGMSASVVPGCERCHGTGIETCTGHRRPPVGDDFLGMTKREAYETLTSRTRAIYDTHTAMVKS